VIALDRRSSALLHRNMKDAGAIVKRRAAGGIRSLLIEATRPHLCRQRQFCRSASPRFRLDERKQRPPHPAPPDVIDYRRPLNLRDPRLTEDESASSARNAVDQRQRMDSVGIKPVQLEARPHALLFHEHGPAQPEALLDVLLASSESDLDHARFAASHRSVATAQSRAPSTQKSASETRLLVENPGM